MLSVSFVFAVICFAGLILFFSGLPGLKTCRIPDPEKEVYESRHKSRLILLALTILYAIIAFWNLGNLSSPESFASMEGNTAILEVNENTLPTQMILFPGVGIGNYRIEYSNDAEGWFPLTTFSQDHVSVLKWQFVPIDLAEPVRYFRLYSDSGNPWLGEVSLLASDGSLISVSSSIPELTDEQLLIPTESNFLNSSYFDEIYHARTAWEHLHRIWPYEISHPPLGKEILSVGILLFGMTPFGWRFSGTLVGVLMLPLMYAFLKRIFGSLRISFLGSVMLASGFMHYVQTRIATIDSYAVFFILLMYYFLYGWLRNHSLRDLALCGISFGLGAACKWICLYAGAGLGILWMIHWTEDILENGRGQVRCFIKNSVFCLLFFILIPALIYYISYLPYGLAQGTPIFSMDYTKLVLENQAFMFNYHSSIVAEHPYSSRWFQWVLDIRPILYYLEYYPDGSRISLAAFVNPLICWGGLLSIPILIYTSIFRKDHTSRFLLAAYFSGLIPWVFISRLTFEYHYFASALFLVPILCYVFWLLENNKTHGKVYSAAFVAGTVILFVYFFPVLNGIRVDNELASKLLGWLPSWPI